MKNVSFCVYENRNGFTDYSFFLFIFLYKVEFATIKIVDEKLKYELYQPEEIETLLKEQNVGANATAATETATQ